MHGKKFASKSRIDSKLGQVVDNKDILQFISNLFRVTMFLNYFETS